VSTLDALHTPEQVVRETCAVVLAGGRGARLMELTATRAKPAVPFAGGLRIIDFTLSNCVNSGIRHISVLTQYKALDLIRHVSRAWGFLDGLRGEYIESVPAQQQGAHGWYRGTADAVHQNLDLVLASDPAWVLVLAGDHVYKMDYGRLLVEHVARGADATVACLAVPLAQASAFGVVCTDGLARVTAFCEKPRRPQAMVGHPEQALVSMGVYVFSAPFLRRELSRDAVDRASLHDFGVDVLPIIFQRARVYAHDFAQSCVQAPGSTPYWRDVGTLDAYWQAHMDLVRPEPALDLDDPAWPIRGMPGPVRAARFVFDEDGCRGLALDSLVCGGCVVRGSTVRRSVLFAGVQLAPGSVVEDCVVLPGARVGERCIVRRAIIDEGCELPTGLRIGVQVDEDRARFTVSPGGVTLVTPPMLAAAPHGRAQQPPTAGIDAR